MGRLRLAAAAAALLVVTGLTVVTAGATIIPGQKVNGVSLGMTVAQAKAALGSCPTLGGRAGTDRRGLKCYFSPLQKTPGGVSFDYRSFVKKNSSGSPCGAQMGLAAGRVVDVLSDCPDRLANGVGVGSTFSALYQGFAKGTVRCGNAFTHWCASPRRGPGGRTVVTRFTDAEGNADLVVAWVEIFRCPRTYPAHSFNPCSPTFLTDPRNRIEFTP